MNPSALPRLMRTLRYLRASQVAAQLRTRLFASWHDASWVAERTPPSPPGVRWRPVARWLTPDPQANTSADLLAGRFTFVGEQRDLAWPPDWTGGRGSLLWRYNFQYLEWIWALPPDERLAAALAWTAGHPPSRDAVGWSPYPTSVRLHTLCLLCGNEAAADALWPAIWRQAEHLSRRLEYHLLGNHLLENGIALALAGACFAGPAADRWRQIGIELLRRQLAEQVLADGMHFERSPMYQVRLTHALATLANTGDAEIRELVVEPLGRMKAALATVCHPDGQIALLNDAAFGIYAEPMAVIAFAQAVGAAGPAVVPDTLPEAGYYVGRNARGDAVFYDAGPLGPDYLPGHAHGDMFSFELSLAGRRVVVDGGTYDYVASPMRSYCRSTVAHNTVSIDGADQAEFWGAFRVGRRGKPHDVRRQAASDGFTVSGWHDGFRHLRGAPVHHRTVRWHDAGVVVIRDDVTGRRPGVIASRIHLHPDCRVVEAGRRSVKLACGDLCWSVTVADGPPPRLDEGWYCPRFGVRQRSQVLVFESVADRVRWTFALTRGHDAEFSPDGRSLIAEGCRHAA